MCIMQRWSKTATIALAAFMLLGIPTTASSETKDDTVQRLRASRDSERYQKTIENQAIKAGGARILIDAPLPIVRAIIQDYAKYQDFMPRFKRSRVVESSEKHTDVYLQVPILHGAANVWSVVKFENPIKSSDGSELIQGKMTQGNVKDFQAIWRLTPIDANTTLLQSEILIVPALPVPGSVVTGELGYAADMAVTSTRNRAEAWLKKIRNSG
jgi:ribosome-associated toxin RatA of RatAB toxin-antitoxin module